MTTPGANALPTLRKDWRYHFLGIGGVGMSGIAELLHRTGYGVTGSDARRGHGASRLMKLGIPVTIGHDAGALDGVDLIVYSSALDSGHPIWEEVERRGLSRVHRAEMLGALTARMRTLAVTGTHGKTTASACLAHVLAHVGADPTALVGGYVPQFGGGNILVGNSPWLVIEADESDGSFVHFKPEAVLLTNVEADHLDFHGSAEAVEQVFGDFLQGLPPEGVLIYCADDPGASRAARGFPGRTIGYGQSSAAHLRFEARRTSAPGMEVVLMEDGREWGFQSELLGLHNAANMAGVFATACHTGSAPEAVIEGLAGFQGVARRQELIGEVNGVRVFDDYAHHPTEVEATLGLFRTFHEGPITVVFQPHLFSRTKYFAAEFARALAVADRVYLADIYPAREKPIPGVTSQLILEHLGSHPAAFHLPDWRELPELVGGGEIPPGILLLMGAGDITEAGPRILEVAGG